MRDPGVLESALYRPQTGYYADLVAEGAALLQSLAINHAFADDNERVAVAVTDVFLRINGHRTRGASGDIHAESIRMFDSAIFDLAHLKPWLCVRVVAVGAGG